MKENSNFDSLLGNKYGLAGKNSVLLENMSEGLIVEDANHRIIYANPAFAKMTGISENECIGKELYSFFDAKNKKIFIEEVKNGLHGKIPSKQIELITSDKKNVSVLIGATASENGECSIIFIDLSGLADLQKKFKYESEKYFKMVQNSYKEVGKIKRKLDLIEDLINYTGIDMPVDEFYSFVLSSFMKYSKADGGVLRLFNSQKKKFFLKKFNGLPEDWKNKKPIEYSGSVIEKAIAEGGILKVPDISDEPLYSAPKLAQKAGYNHMMITTLNVKSKLLGYVSLYFKNIEKMDAVDLEFISSFSKLSSINLVLFGKQN